MALEQWQRYLKANPCPICGGYGAYREERRCKGFRTADGLGAYCSQTPNGRSPKDFGGFSLYYHEFMWPEMHKGEGEDSKTAMYKHRLYRLREHGRLRREARLAEARRPPTVRDFG